MARRSLGGDSQIEHAVLEITRRFQSPFSLEQLAEAVQLSPFHFHRRFLRVMGETPMGYLRRIRLSHADHLLAAMPDASLLAIALESGFSSPACFSRAYRQAFGLTPSEARAKLLPTQARAPRHMLTLRPTLVHIPTRHYKVQRLPLDEATLGSKMMALSATASTPALALLGIFADAPFHVPRPQCRYFVALENQTCTAETPDSLTLPGGYYARLVVCGDLDGMGRAVFDFHDQVLVPAGYSVASTLFFERFSLPDPVQHFDYALSEREVFIKVRAQGKPVI